MSAAQENTVTDPNRDDISWQAALSATGKQQVGEVQEAVSKEAVRQFIADRAPNDENREDILSGDYDHTLWFDHIRELMEALAARQPGAQMPVDDDWHLRGYAYASKQATTCAGCGKHKHTPLRIDAMAGHVCLTCIDQKLGVLLGEFGYPPAQGIDLGQLREKLTKLTRRNEFISGQMFSYVQLDDVQTLIDQRDAAPGVGA